MYHQEWQIRKLVLKLVDKKELSHAITVFSKFQFSSVQSLSRVRLFATPWIAACQASLSITNPQSLLKPISEFINGKLRLKDIIQGHEVNC